VYDTSPTGSFVPNGYGLHDMAGNVAEWCWDQWSGDYRVCRGGGCQSYAIDLRCGQRGYFDMPHWLGFRTIRSAGELK
jgi:formylglycine-generating enzyme required for sulfatase activity